MCRLFQVVIVGHGIDPHVAAFEAAAQGLIRALFDLRYLVLPTIQNETVLVGAHHEDTRFIVFAGHTAKQHRIAELPPKSIVYNFEQAGSPQAIAWEYLKLLADNTVWEYSAANAARSAHVDYLVPFGYHKALEQVPQDIPKDIDVLVYGSMNPRRQRILTQLKDMGIKYTSIFNVYGAQLDAYLARAKLVLNIHFYEAAIFEQLRVGYCVANNIPVISEISAGNEGKNLASCVKYEHLAEHVHQALKLPEELVYQAEMHKDWFIKNQSYVDILKPILVVSS